MFNRVAVKAGVVLALALAGLVGRADEAQAAGVCSTCMTVDRCMFNYAQECAMLCGENVTGYACTYTEECAPGQVILWCLTGDQ